MKQFLKITLSALLAAAACNVSSAAVKGFDNLPSGADPSTVGTRIAEQFLTTQDPSNYRPKGFTQRVGVGNGRHLHYSIVSLWTNALSFAEKTGNKDLERRLIEKYGPYRAESRMNCNKRNHVDYCVFGALPLQLYMMTGDESLLKAGLLYADAQWAEPDPNDPGANGNYPIEGQKAWMEYGYTPQTRLWIDDMYMINLLQTQAYLATGDRKYIDRAAKEMVLYLDLLQNEDGLFYHTPGIPFVWGRGDGWMAAGMPMILKHLDRGTAEYDRILKGYRKMMEALLRTQRENGLWGQLVLDPGSWDETSCSAMFTFGIIEGLKHGWLPQKEYTPAARKAWLELCGKLDGNANISDVCCGTAAKNDRDWYLARPRINGDPHGQAPMMWICNALLER